MTSPPAQDPQDAANTPDNDAHVHETVVINEEIAVGDDAVAAPGSDAGVDGASVQPAPPSWPSAPTTPPAFPPPEQQTAQQAPPTYPAQPPAGTGYAPASSQGYPGQAYPGQAYPPPAYPGQAYPGQAYPPPAYPGQAYPGQAYPGQAYPGQVYPGQVYPVVPARQTSTNAIVSLVLSITAWVVCPVIPAVVALILAQQAAKEIAAAPERVTGMGLVSAARWVSWINIGLYAAIILLLGLFFLIAAII